MSWGFYKPYVSVAKRRASAAKEASKQAKAGNPLSPVHITGRKIAQTFWGKSWCEHLESYSDYANRLPRGRTYARNGSILDLKIAPGKITALVMGSSPYKQSITIAPMPPGRWQQIKKACSGRIDSLVELLQGRLSDAVMGVICDRKTGLFPAPSEIVTSCSCPDFAGLCKHLAAVLYGVGARFDTEPELLFKLRGVPLNELISEATEAQTVPAGEVDAAFISDVFGIEIATTEAEVVPKAAVKAKAPAKAKAPVKAKTPVKAKAPNKADALAKAKAELAKLRAAARKTRKSSGPKN